MVDDGFAMDEAARAFFAAIEAGFATFVGPAPYTGVCQFSLIGEAEPIEFHVVVGDRKLWFVDGTHPAPTTSVKIPAASLALLANEANVPGDLFRGIQITGNPDLAYMFGYLVCAPPETNLRLFDEAEQLASREVVDRVERVDRPSTGDVVERIRAGRPFVATGALDAWGWQHWSFARLAADHAALEVADARAGGFISLRAFVERMMDPALGMYTAGCTLPEGLDSCFRPLFFPDRACSLRQIWMGSKRGTVTWLHRDPWHGFLGQIIGRKRLLLFSPEQSSWLYPYARYNSDQPCCVDGFHIDTGRYPLAGRARPLEVVLDPGELLVCPKGWFHCVAADQPVMSVSFFADPAHVADPAASG